jgi:di- and tripeptidase
MILVQNIHHHDAGNEVLVTGGGDGTIKMWSVDSLETAGLVTIHKFKNASASVLSLAQYGIFLYAGLTSGRVHVYNLDSQQLIHKINVGCDDVTTIQVVDGVAFCGTSNGLSKVLETPTTMKN